MSSNVIRTLFLIPVLLFVLFLSACTDREEPSEQRLLTYAGSLTGLGIHSAEFQLMTNMFEDEISELRMEQFEEEASANDADLLFLEYDTYLQLMEQGKLMPLDPLIAGSNLSWTDFDSEITNAMRHPGDQQVYGMPLYFDSDALVYNKDLFAQVGVDEPVDRMSWEEVWQLAERVTVDESQKRIFGFRFYPFRSGYRSPDINDLLSLYTPPLNLRIFNEQKTEMTVKTEEWEQIFAMLHTFRQDHVIPGHAILGFDPEGPIENNPFLYGMLAMGIVPYSEWVKMQVLNAHADAFEQFQPFELGAVQMPVHTHEMPERTGVYLDKVIAISANADKPEDAWQFFEFVFTDWMNLHQANHMIPVLIAARFNLAPDADVFLPQQLAEDPHLADRLLHAELFTEIVAIGNEQLEHVLANRLTVEQALQAWQSEGNKRLKNKGEQAVCDTDC